MAWSAVTSAVTTIGELLTEEAIYLWGVEEQVDRLQTELQWMQSSLMVAETKQSTDERIRLWVAEIRELAYDAEDIVEEFALKIGSKNKGGLPSCIKRSACCLKEGWVLHETRSKIEKIIERINDLVRRLQAYGVKELKDKGEESSFSTERRESRRPYPHIMDDNIVGLVDDTEGLVKVLTKESGCKVVTIWGMGGLGKTTLAKKIYHHPQVVDYFDHLAFVYVSQPCRKRNVWEDILSGFKTLDKKDRKKTDEDLAKKLCKTLEDKKCLVILDDVWTSEAWDSLKPAFPVATGRDSNSKILLTSRNKGIVSDAAIRELNCLNDEESWELFQKIVFPQTGNIIDVEMKKLGENMVKDCAGLPLAIVVLGGILATKKNLLNEWRKISDNVKSYLKRGKNQGPEDVLALSYDDLPLYLRPCFLYLSHFPEDYMIDVDSLIQLWVAEGIVSSKQEERDGGEIAEDVAESYLMELVERCMIQVRERDVATLKVKTIQMHDLMRDLCLSKAKQENFVFIVDQSNASSLSMIRKVRRVSVHEFFFIQCIKSPNIRSLLFFNEFFPNEALEKYLPLEVLNYVEEHENDVCNPLYWILLISGISTMDLKARGIWRYMFNNFKLLRVLNYERTTGDRFGGSKLPSDIGNLIHLRFLSLKDLEFLWQKLPSSLRNLRCLQTLDLRVDIGRIHVPNVIWRMEQLRHLYLPSRCKSRTKLKLGTLRKLLTLVNFNTKNCYLKDLINMKNLRELGINFPFNIENFNEKELGENPPIIGIKYDLHSLSIITSGDKSIDPKHLAHLLSNCISIFKLIIKTRISELPEYHYFSSHLAYIGLRWCKLEKDPMPTLEKLPNLRILELESYFEGKEMFCSAHGFPKLESLILTEVNNLEEWKVDEGAMPSLQRLEIKGCLGLKMLPEGLRFITTLKELKIESMPDEFKKRLEEGGEDFYKVKHVPSIIFQRMFSSAIGYQALPKLEDASRGIELHYNPQRTED
ncbi:probable disease resistance protein At1g58602 [Gossypium raimondii]|uniref:probable disease resistance protein At1g58602 n=1 Tax=Gossypium raimondii TaxID=29730 RepID=UPI00227B6842|nr:probable disease resistance protein At1g58602 [Gossypium raimondii]XP_052479736.1 probable disease resistance protein At1g58602 [Gossypium raimondii]